MTFEEVFAHYHEKFNRNAFHTKRNKHVQDMSAEWTLAHLVEEIGEVCIEDVQLGHPAAGKNYTALIEELGDVFGCMIGYLVRRGISPTVVFARLALKLDTVLK